MATTRYQSSDLRRQVGSPRPKGRGSSARTLSTWRDASSNGANTDMQENKDTLCRNVLIYGNCRYEDQGCTFSHEQNKDKGKQNQSDRWVHTLVILFAPERIHDNPPPRSTARIHPHTRQGGKRSRPSTAIGQNSARCKSGLLQGTSRPPQEQVRGG